jgi:2-polyprenyl-3-methyl-5-hydroxy-6-metoxy-1,4-benzoquinol methylase
MKPNQNIDLKTVDSFGDEWARLDQEHLDTAEKKTIFNDYFRIFPFKELPDDAVGFDMGCGSGRWASMVAPQVGRLYCIDASLQALMVARSNLAEFSNVDILHASVDQVDMSNASFDFGYSLGVLHHVPDTAAAIASCAKLLKPRAPFLLYLYYAFDNKPVWYKWIWKL